jgi:hypothetical protein
MTVLIRDEKKTLNLRKNMKEICEFMVYDL